MTKLQTYKQVFMKYTIITSSLISSFIFCAASFADTGGKNESMIKYEAPKTANFDNTKRFSHFTSGTGFFVDNHHIITNEHVVQGCKLIRIRGAIKPSYAKIKATDKRNDLALLKTPRSPKKIAALRSDNIEIKTDEDVIVVGYPLEHGIRGQYIVKSAKITDTQDVFEGNKRIQFTDSVEKGNSGGPLLDGNGTVIGVVVGKMSFYLADSSPYNTENSVPVKTSSMAIPLDNLKNFLKQNNIAYRTDNVVYGYADKQVEHKARDYIVNVHCVKN